jgi:hypothetical protein
MTGASLFASDRIMLVKEGITKNSSEESRVKPRRARLGARYPWLVGIITDWRRLLYVLFHIDK